MHINNYQFISIEELGAYPEIFFSLKRTTPNTVAQKLISRADMDFSCEQQRGE
jgi:hypothetical protein